MKSDESGPQSRPATTWRPAGSGGGEDVECGGVDSWCGGEVAFGGDRPGFAVEVGDHSTGLQYQEYGGGVSADVVELPVQIHPARRDLRELMTHRHRDTDVECRFRHR